MMTGFWIYVVLAASPLDEGIAIEPLSGPREVEVRVQIPDDPDLKLASPGAIEAKVGRRFLALALLQEDGTSGPPLFARYELRPPWLVLKPRYGLAAGATYLATLVGPEGKPVSRMYRVPDTASGETPRVTAVYPSGDRLPANCLKFYLHFSRPMREGRDIFDHVQILDDQGNAMDEPWRRTELWSEDARRLTLWVHPGRIKQGVNLREELGPVLEPHRNYRLVITPSARAADGSRMAEDYIKSFRTTAEDRERPLPEAWRIEAPRPQTRDALHVHFGEPLDRPLLDRFLTVHGSDGPIVGRIEVLDQETHWAFVPDKPWAHGEIELRVDGRLEDLAGNTPLRVFDHDLSAVPLAEPVLALRIRLATPDRTSSRSDIR